MVQEILDVINKCEGFVTRGHELHYGAVNMSTHKLCDDVNKAISDFQDNVAEDAQAIYGQIKVGELSPVLPKATTLVDLLIEIRAMILNMKSTLTENMYTGIINECDDMFHKVNQFIYLARICERGHEIGND